MKKEYKRKEEKNSDSVIQELREILSSLPTIHRVWYAYYTLYEEDQKKAKEEIEKFEKLLIHYPYPQDIESERELIQIVKEKLA